MLGREFLERSNKYGIKSGRDHLIQAPGFAAPPGPLY